MNCSDVVARFTDYLDGSASEDETQAIEDHLEGCSTCVRYKNVLRHGAHILRALPEPELRADFAPRLQHRIYNVDDERALRAHAASGTPAMTVLGIALLLTAVAWSPTVFGGVPTVELPPIVVDSEPEPERDPLRPMFASPPGTFSSKTDADLDEGLWANTLLYDFTPLSQRYERRESARRASQLAR